MRPQKGKWLQNDIALSSNSVSLFHHHFVAELTLLILDNGVNVPDIIVNAAKVGR